MLRRSSSSSTGTSQTHHHTQDVRVPLSSPMVHPSFRRLFSLTPYGLYAACWATDPNPGLSNACARRGSVFTTSTRQVLRPRGRGNSSHCALVLVVFHNGQVFPSWVGARCSWIRGSPNQNGGEGIITFHLHLSQVLSAVQVPTLAFPKSSTYP